MPRLTIAVAGLALVAAAPAVPNRTVVNGTSAAERAAHPDMRFSSRAEASANCERGTVRASPGGGYSCSSLARPIERTTTRRRNL